MRGSVKACISDCQFPVSEELILLLQSREAPSFQGVLLDIANTTLNLAFMAWRVGACWEKHSSVVFAKGANLGIDLRVIPVRPFDGGLEVIHDQPLGYSTKVPEGTFEASKKVLRGLAVNDLAIPLS